jgi:flagellar biosynthesis protein FlhG
MRKPGYTVAEVCHLTQLEEFRLRFYESEFSEFLPPVIQVGDRALFSREAIEILTEIREHADLEGLSISAIKDVLNRAGSDNDTLLVENSGCRGKVIAVTSGKGGVGKTTVALNLGLALHRRGYKTLLFDADLGTANLHILSGIDSSITLEHVITEGKPLSQAITSGPEGLAIIPGGSGVLDLGELPASKRDMLIYDLESLEEAVDYIIIDTAPGITPQVTDFLKLADLIIIVTTPELTSITDGYGMIKTMTHKSPDIPIAVIVNNIYRVSEGDSAFARLETCSRQFLSRSLIYTGYLARDGNVSLAVSRRMPVMQYKPECRFSRGMLRLASMVESIKITPKEARYERFESVVGSA